MYSVFVSFRRHLPSLILAALVGALAAPPAAAFTIVSYAPTVYDANEATMDAALGITGLPLERFEDVNLEPGLSIEWFSPALGPVTVLPQLDNSEATWANTKWDGPNVASTWQQRINGAANRSTRTTVSFAGGRSMVGFGLSNVQFVNNGFLQINGTDFIALDSIPSLVIDLNNIQRAAYLKVLAGAGEVINSVGLRSIDGNDYMSFDHMVMVSVPEPGTAALLGAATLAAIGRRRRSRRA